MRPINRIAPKMGPAAYQTYAVATPLETHWREATCTEVACPHEEHGWKTAVDEASDLGQRQAHYIRKLSGRTFHEHVEQDGLTTFLFPPGQRCFREHRIKEDRPALYIVRGGDYRATVTPPVRMRAEDWVDKFAEHQYNLKVAQEKG